MRRLIAAALLCASTACAQEAEAPSEPLPPIPDDTYKRGGRPASVWEERATVNARIRDRNISEPPAPPLQDHPCDSFAAAGPDGLIEIKLISDVDPEPVAFIVPELTAGVNQHRYRWTDLDGSVQLAFWVHDLAPFFPDRAIWSLAKSPADDLRILAGPGGKARIDRVLRIRTRMPGAELEAREVSPDSPLISSNEEHGLREIAEMPPEFDPYMVRGWVRFDEDGELADFIHCRKAKDNHRCYHSMNVGKAYLSIGYDHEFLPEWQRIRDDVKEFMQCGFAAYEEDKLEQSKGR